MATALIRVQKMLAQHKKFADRVGRPFSRDTAEGGVGWTDLHYAAVLDLPGVITALLNAGMAVDTRLKAENSPPFGDLKRTLVNLHHGDEFGNWNAVGETPLMIASVVNSRKALEYLVGGGADINAKDMYGRTPLHYAARRDAVKVAEYLVGQGADINAKDHDDDTPLHYAAWRNAVKVAEYLVGGGADINAKDMYGETPLHEAAQRDAVKVMEYLVGEGADINAKENNNGATALHLVAWRDAVKVAEYLVGQGADINAKDNHGRTPLQRAKYVGAAAVAKFLEDFAATAGE